MIHPSYWLTNQAIDLVNSDEYKNLHAEFMTAFSTEKIQTKPPITTMGERDVLYALALNSLTALFSIFYDHIQPRFSKTHGDPSFWRNTMPYWTFNTFAFIEQGVKDKERNTISLCEKHFNPESCRMNVHQIFSIIFIDAALDRRCCFLCPFGPHY
ncbi:hypothetical protein N7539_006987 [Penicillium diatomitis]|uniref:Uncharacterized protein n=1 Tax=Penicillium diatomitis TaxID=2819901 RepID=A0A9W9X2C3_9EURO|nr:uncharacterized protein N7539_006987 [Penicillium diatomitis]KAJ5481093.1 hypothetical protein N7539_006987 [Penicillium diatomitis]